jgi:altronate dehydratase large subunit
MGFQGYLRADGSVGIRNHVVLIASVSCANGVVNAVARQFPEVKALTHTEGCGRGPTDLVNATRTLVGLGKNPNVAAVVVVGLGCEYLKAPWIASEIKSSGKPVEMLVIQGEGGSQKTTEKALSAVRRLLDQTRALEAAEFDWNKLTLGLECGGESEAARSTSPALGACGDWLVGEGGKVIVAELAEMASRESSLAERVARPELIAKIEAAFDNRQKLVLKALGRELAHELPPGAGSGLSALASRSKVSDVLEFAEAPSGPGLYLMDTPGSEIFSMTAMAAGGAQLIVQTTEHGIPGGCPVAPVIKVSTTSELFTAMDDDIDFDAGRISGGTPPAEIGRELVELVGEVARGQKTKAEINGYDLFALHTSGPAF